MRNLPNILSRSRAGKPGKHAAKREEQVQLLLAAKMRIFCRLPRAGYKTADDTDLYAPLNDAYHVQVAEQGTQVPAAR